VAVWPAVETAQILRRTYGVSTFAAENYKALTVRRAVENAASQPNQRPEEKEGNSCGEREL